jgi:subtilisin family serine protease
MSFLMSKTNIDLSLPKSSAEWMGWAMDTGRFDLALRFRNNPNTPRVRIAILDTGYDSNSPFFSLAVRRKRLVKWRDFAKDSPEPVDDDGHGTHMVSLAMKMAPAADIYVARVASSSAGLQDARQDIADVSTLC